MDPKSKNGSDVQYRIEFTYCTTCARDECGDGIENVGRCCVQHSLDTKKDPKEHVHCKSFYRRSNGHAGRLEQK